MAAQLKKSGQRRNSKASQLRLDPFTLFLDENHCDNAHILRMLGETLRPEERVERATQRFPPGTYDELWLPEAGKNGWIVVSADTRLWRRSILRQVLFHAGVRAFIFTENNLRGETRAEILRKALPEMRAMVRETPPPFIASLTVEGHARLIFDAAMHKTVLNSETRTTKKRAKRKK